MAAKSRTPDGRSGSVALGALLATMTTAAVCGVILVAQGVVRFADTDARPVTPPPATVTAEKGNLRDVVRGETKAPPGVSVDVTANGVVTRSGAAVGAEVKSGGLIGVVDERPIFLLEGDVPVFRDLAPGDSGRDVRALQRALDKLGYAIAANEADASKFGWTTAKAVYDFYLDMDFLPVDASGNRRNGAQIGSTGVPKEELVMSPSTPLTPIVTCGRAGDPVAGRLCTLAGPPYGLTIEVPVTEAERIKPGMTVEHDGTPIGKIEARLGDPTEATTSGDKAGTGAVPTARFSVKAASGTTAGPDLEGSSEVVVAEATDVAIIDAIAIRGTPDNPWVERASGGRTDITVTLCVTGRCAVTGVEPGTELVIATPGP